MSGSLRHHREILHDAGMGGDLGERRRRADLESALICLDVAQLGYAIDIDEDRRRDDTAADVHDEIGAAAKETAFGMGRARSNDLRQGRRRNELELGSASIYGVSA